MQVYEEEAFKYLVSFVLQLRQIITRTKKELVSSNFVVQAVIMCLNGEL